MLYDLNINRKWRKLLQKDDVDIHSKDIEFIVRAFMLLVDYKKYKPSMTRALNKFSKEAKSYKTDSIDYFKELFISFLNSCDLLDDGAFCINNRFNISKFDATFATICRPYFEKKETINGFIDPDTFKSLTDDIHFNECTQSSTASVKSVIGRINIAENILKIK